MKNNIEIVYIFLLKSKLKLSQLTVLTFFKWADMWRDMRGGTGLAQGFWAQVMCSRVDGIKLL